MSKQANNPLADKSYQLALQIVNVYKELTNSKK